MNAANKILPTRNEAWGLHGTIRHHADPSEAWPLAMRVVSAATGCSEAGVREFLDSREGRHFADDVASALAKGAAIEGAVHVAADRWMSWSIGRRISRETGIPRGLPYLVGFVTHYEIIANAAA